MRTRTEQRSRLLDPALDWAYLERLATSLPVPVVVKGVLDPEDAVLAAEHGAAGIVVSNHGGRQLDGVLPTLEGTTADRRCCRRQARSPASTVGSAAAPTSRRRSRSVRGPCLRAGCRWGLAARGEDGAHGRCSSSSARSSRSPSI